MTPMDVDKGEVEVDELEDDDFQDEEDNLKDSEIYDTALEPSTAEILTTHQLHTMIHEGVIDLNPPYQRDVVWPETKQIGLIDSIFRNFFIPPVIFAVQQNEYGEEVRVCVDGKQRLTSIQKFFDGIIPHRNSRTKKSFWYTLSDSNKGVKIELPEKHKEDFRGKNITVVEYRGLPPGSEREIFQRVQLGMTLTAAEKLQAISSPWARWIGELEQKHVNIDEGLAAIMTWDVTRGRDFQNIAHMVYCCDGFPEELLPTAQKIEKWISRVDPPTKQFQDDIENVLRVLWVIASKEEYRRGFTEIQQRVAPVEFIFIGVLLYVLRAETRETQATAIYILRHTVRQEFTDIRNNANVGKAMWGYINGLKKHPTTMLITGKEIVPKGKRKRGSGMRDDDDEFKPQPIRSLGKPVKTRTKKSKSG